MSYPLYCSSGSCASQNRGCFLGCVANSESTTQISICVYEGERKPDSQCSCIRAKYVKPNYLPASHYSSQSVVTEAVRAGT